MKLEEIESHFRSRVREIVRIPYDPQLAAGSVVSYKDLQPSRSSRHARSPHSWSRDFRPRAPSNSAHFTFGAARTPAVRAPITTGSPPVAERPIRLFGDPVLKTVSDPITVIDERVRGLVADLIDSVRLPGRAGVAAAQIGVNLRAFSYNVDGEIGYILNPVIVELTGEPELVDEGACRFRDSGTRRCATRSRGSPASTSNRSRSNSPGPG